MGTLLLKLSGPLQSWGVDSRFNERKTRHEPTKSGIVGLLASALGRRREDSIEDLVSIPLAVRIDQPGSYERDFQTAHLRKFDKKTEAWTMGKSLPLSRRYYLADAVFVAGLEVSDELIDEYANALLHPAFPLYLGRRACPPSDKVLLAVHKGDGLMQAISEWPWEASRASVLRSHNKEAFVRLEVLRDELPDDGENPVGLQESLRDVPISFSQINRTYGWRTVVHQFVNVTNPHFDPPVELDHDPLSVFEEVK